MQYVSFLWAPVDQHGRQGITVVIRQVEKLLDAQSRGIVGAPKYAARVCVRGELGLEPMWVRWIKDIVLFWKSVLFLPDGRPVRVICMALWDLHVTGRHRLQFFDKLMAAGVHMFGVGCEARFTFKGTKARWDRDISAGYDRLCQLVYKQEMATASHGLALIKIKPLRTVAYYLVLASCSRKYGRNDALYRMIQLRGGGHHLNCILKYFGGDHDGMCRCGQFVETPVHFWSGCKLTESKFVKFARGLTGILGDKGQFESSLLCKPTSALERWCLTMQWLDGPMVSDDRLQLLVLDHILDYLQELLDVHPNYGGRS